MTAMTMTWPLENRPLTALQAMAFRKLQSNATTKQEKSQGGKNSIRWRAWRTQLSKQKSKNTPQCLTRRKNR